MILRPRQSPENFRIGIENIPDSEEFIDYFIQKFQIKDEFITSLSQDDKTNDWKEWKRLWIFIFHYHTLTEEIINEFKRNWIHLNSDKIWELHIPFQNISLKDIWNSLNRLNEYLRYNSKKVELPEYIFWISYLAEFSRRYWFHIVDLPKSVKRNSWAARLLEKYTNDTSNSKKQKILKRFSIEDIKLCYISIEELLNKRVNDINIVWTTEDLYKILSA